MDDTSQKSSMSLTQENPVSAYQHLFSAIPSNQLPSTNAQDARKPENIHNLFNSDPPIVFKQTIDQYDDNPKGSDNFENNLDVREKNLDQEQIETEDEDESSLDVLRRVSRLESSHEDQQEFEPHTPALAVNPFKSKGTVMHKLELFAATQPSSVDRQAISPASSRPSPHEYDAFSSPMKREKLLVSPLVGYTTQDRAQALARTLREHSYPEQTQYSTTRNSRIQSFNKDIRQSRLSSMEESCPQSSFAENREDRKHPNISASEDSNSGLEYMPKHQDYDRPQYTQRDPSNRESRRPLPEFRPKSSIPLLANKVSSRQHRSLQELDIAQSVGQEAQNIPSQYVSDSQICSIDENSEIITPATLRNLMCENNGKEVSRPISWTQAEGEKEKTISSSSSSSCRNSQSQNFPSQPESIIKHTYAKELNLPTLPSQECHTGSINFKSLVDQNCLHSENAEVVPETSPISQQHLPMEKVATIHPESKHQALKLNISSFTRDLEYEDAIRINHSPNLCVARASNKTKSNMGTLSTTKQSAATQLSSKIVANLNLIPRHLQLSAQVEQESELSDKENCPEIELLVAAAQKEGLSKRSLNSIKKKKPRNDDFLNSMKEKIHDKTSGNRTPSIDQLSAQPTTQGEIRMGVKVTTESLQSETNLALSGSSTRKSNRYSLERPAKSRSKSLSAVRSGKSSPHSSPDITQMSAPKCPTRRGSRKSDIVKAQNQLSEEKPSKWPVAKRKTKRKSITTSSSLTPLGTLTRSSKRSSKDNSEDPLSASIPLDPYFPHYSGLLFSNMAFAVSYVKNDKERKAVIQMISDNGGRILEDGFDSLFESSSKTSSATFDTGALSLSKVGKLLCFAAVIADEHSRKTKYVQALALGLPCISGRWIQSCVLKSYILDWSPYLLCAGQSSVLGNACRSRILQPYSATEAELSNTFLGRKKIFEGKSVLLITGKGKVLEKRKTFSFLARALGPARIGHVADLSEARKSLLEAETQGHEWDLLHVHDNEKNLASDIFTGNGKRKNIDGSLPCPKKVRIITDEIMIQSLIFGELLDE